MTTKATQLVSALVTAVRSHESKNCLGGNIDEAELRYVEQRRALISYIMEIETRLAYLESRDCTRDT